MKDDYFIDYDMLASVIDALIKEKYHDEQPSEIKSLREESIKQLDGKISEAFFESLTDEQADELSEMLDNNASQTDVQEYLDNLNIDLSEVIANAIQQFGKDFLGGSHE